MILKKLEGVQTSGNDGSWCSPGQSRIEARVSWAGHVLFQPPFGARLGEAVALSPRRYDIGFRAYDFDGRNLKQLGVPDPDLIQFRKIVGPRPSKYSKLFWG